MKYYDEEVTFFETVVLSRLLSVIFICEGREEETQTPSADTRNGGIFDLSYPLAKPISSHHCDFLLQVSVTKLLFN